MAGSRTLFQALKVLGLSNKRALHSPSCICFARGRTYPREEFGKLQKDRKADHSGDHSAEGGTIETEPFASPGLSVLKRGDDRIYTAWSEELYSKKTVPDLLAYLSSQLHLVSDEEIVEASSRLVQIQNKAKLPSSYFKRNADFLGFLDLLRRRSRFLITAQDSITVLKMLLRCEVPLTSRVGVVVLHSLKDKVNDLDLYQLTYLQSLLRLSRDTTPLSEAILRALPELISANVIETRDHRGNAAALLVALTSHVFNPQKDLKVQNEILRNLLGNVSTLSMENVRKLVYYLCRLSHRLFDKSASEENQIGDPLVEVLYSEAVAELLKHVNKYSPLHLVETASSMMINKKGTEFIYNEYFCSSLAKRVVSERWSGTDAFNAAYSLSKLHHVDPDLCEYLDDIALEAIPAIVSQKASFSSCLAYWSSCGWRPKNINPFFDALLKEGNHVLAEVNTSALVWFCCESMSLGRICPTLLKTIFCESNFKRILENESSFHKVRLLQLQLAILAFSKGLNLPRIPENLHAECLLASERMFLEKNRSGTTLIGALEQAFGGPEFVVDGAVTALGNVIDYVVVLRDKDFQPVSIKQNEETDEAKSETNSLTLLEKISVPPGCTRYHILVFGREAYASNSLRLKGLNTLRVNVTSKLDGVTLAIAKPTWLELPDNEKIPYLVGKLRSAKSDDSDEFSVVVR